MSRKPASAFREKKPDVFNRKFVTLPIVSGREMCYTEELCRSEGPRFFIRRNEMKKRRVPVDFYAFHPLTGRDPRGIIPLYPYKQTL